MRTSTARFALLAMLALRASAALAGEGETSLRFFGHGGSAGDNYVFPDRVRVLIDPSVPADVGAADFTIEFWMKGSASENPNPPQACGFGIDWVNGNILIDRDRYNQGRKFGISLLGGSIAWGVSSNSVSYTLCGAIDVLDDVWHHVAVERRVSDGRMWIFVDGELDATGPVSGGPAGDVSYPNGAVPGNFCSPDGGSGGSPCPSDCYLVFGAEKHGFSGINFSGWLDEIRLSDVLRYTASFARPTAPFAPDANTAAIYHLDEGVGTMVSDASGAAGGPSNGAITYGGSPPPGPEWSADTPFVSGTGVERPVDASDETDSSDALVAPALRVLAPAPNPFRDRVTLRFELDRERPLSLRVYDSAGRAVTTLWSGRAPAGAHEIVWDGTNLGGEHLPAGTYFVHGRAAAETHTERLVLLR